MMMQNKPICILDEPTSDQDAHFKEFFYTQLIPMLKKDRCLIIISDDPSYFHLADQVIYLEQGKLARLPPWASK